MVDFRAILADRSVNAAVAWLSTVVLVLASATLFAAREWLWLVFVGLVLGVVLLSPLLARDVTTTLPGELVALVTIPIVVRATGTFLQATPFVTLAGLALLVVLLLDAFTSLEMAPRFAVLFVVITTMAFAGIWAMGEFAADLFLGTEFIGGQRALNISLVTATVVGAVAGVVFGVYFRETGGDSPLSRTPLGIPFRRVRSQEDGGGDADGSDLDDGIDPTVGVVPEVPDRQTEDTADPATSDESDPSDVDESDPDAAEESDPSDVVEEADPSDGVTEAPKYRWAIRALQLVLVAIVGYSIVTVQATLFVNSAVPLALTLLPVVARRRYGYPMHAGLALLISLAATLHAVGALGPYQTTDWYDTVTHALSSTLVAGVGYVIARGIELHTDKVSFSPRFRGAFIVLFVLAVGVLWEILEFASGIGAGLFGAEVLAQYGVSDIVKDLTFNSVGAIAVALWGTGLFRRPARMLSGSVGQLFRRG
ncbi:hypothetical protein L593_12425 [Salinarchaeum sp. Harcht-Bsk1]|uniref:hypothetical protein n=1 Tax=Salinarchaeum sp. Harcht-Bsk1 TaxID=1333523 RepID=UPI00034227E8|nr:hypothetical protein [Salinarchaeum sp. Harcht-Bsk1]AGN02424.1 hypothetical protein L593_12425 [Salinarchaeum sp. Harcht-Bsk1]